MPQELQQTVAVFKGHVQGVGFRYTVQRISRQFPVTGHVRNLDDGSVEVLAEGSTIMIEQFIDTISIDMARYIRAVHVEAHAYTGSFAGFTVAF
jgi:acylphosphatase